MSIRRPIWDLDHPEALHDLRSIIAEMAWMEPDLSPRTINAAIISVVGSRAQLRLLADQIRCDLDLLFGSSNATPIVYQFFIALKRAGSSNIRLPTCDRCWREAPLVKKWRNGKRICSSCYKQVSKPRCSLYGRWRLDCKFDGQPLCHYCEFATDPQGSGATRDVA